MPEISDASPALLKLLGISREALPLTPWLSCGHDVLSRQLSPQQAIDIPELWLESPGGASIRVAMQGLVDGDSAQVIVTRLAQSEALQELRDRHELALESARIGMWDWDVVTGTVHFDARWCEMLGYAHHELPSVYDSWATRVHPEDLDLALQKIRAHVDGESPTYEMVHRMRHKDGAWRYILTRGRVVERDRDGSALRFVGAHADVTREKEAELEALELVRSRTLFLATMSHEIRTPLHGMLGAIEVMELHDLPAATREVLDVMRGSGDLLMSVVNDALELARVEHEDLVVNTEPFDLAALLRQLVELHRSQVDSAQVDVRLELQGHVGWVRGDGNRLRQIVGNLLGNAVRFTEAGSVVLRVLQDEDHVVIQVVDTGPGIENVERIWRPFALGDASMSRKHGGTGLGLTITRALVEVLGGSIGVVTEVGSGSTFRVELPFEECSAVMSLSARGTGEQRCLSVVVVDDNPVNLMVAERLLQSLGHQVRAANSGREALMLCSRAEPDVVLMDLHMPGLDGIQTLQALRAQGTSAAALAVTADVAASERGTWAEAGFEGYLSKPFSVAQLRQALAAAVRPSVPSVPSSRVS